MPFRSKSQEKWMYANHPEMARKWSEHTPAQEQARLPEHVEREARERAARAARKGPKVVER
jgi:hypothetical protein